VFAKGGSQGGNLYDYRPAGVLSDSGLHPPPTGNGSQFAGISHILFCYGTPSKQGPVTPGGTNGGTTNNTSGTTTQGVTVTAPSTQNTSPNGTKNKAPSKTKAKAKKKAKHTLSRRARGRAGFTG
jgi:hypothetical protein